MTQYFEWRNQTANVRKIAGTSLVVGLILFVLGFIFAGAASASGANAIAVAMAAFILLWIPAAVLFIFAALFFLISKMRNSDAEEEKSADVSSLESVDASGLLICSTCSLELFPDLAECAWCAQEMPEASSPKNTF